MFRNMAKRLMAACGLLLSASSQAGFIGFDDLTPNVYGDSELVAIDSTFLLTTNGLGLIGDALSCFVAQCPSGNDTQSWYALNDGGFNLHRVDNGAMQLFGFDVAYVAAFPIFAPETLLGRILVDAYSSTGAWLNTWQFDLPTQSFDGNFNFARIDVSALDISGHSFRFSSCTFDEFGDCQSSYYGLNQFAIDNIHVPTTPALTLFVLGLAGLVSLRRRAQ